MVVVEAKITSMKLPSIDPVHVAVTYIDDAHPAPGIQASGTFIRTIPGAASTNDPVIAVSLPIASMTAPLGNARIVVAVKRVHPTTMALTPVDLITLPFKTSMLGAEGLLNKVLPVSQGVCRDGRQMRVGSVTLTITRMDDEHVVYNDTLQPSVPAAISKPATAAKTPLPATPVPPFITPRREPDPIQSSVAPPTPRVTATPVRLSEPAAVPLFTSSGDELQLILNAAAPKPPPPPVLRQAFPFFHEPSLNWRKEEWRLSVVIHSASNLPSLSVGRVPRALVRVRVGPVDACTSAAMPSRYPVWNTPLVLMVPHTLVAKTIDLSIEDSDTHEEVQQYSIPLPYMQPYTQYFLELVQGGNQRGMSTCSLCITACLEPPVNHEASQACLEVCLRGFNSPLITTPDANTNANIKNNATTGDVSVLAVVKLVTDQAEYEKNAAIAPHTLPPARSLWSVTMPCTSKDALAVPVYNPTRGAPDSPSQVCSSLDGSTTPQFDALYTYAYNPTEVFTPHSAVIIEFYRLDPDKVWMPKTSDLLAYLALPMNVDHYRALAADPVLVLDHMDVVVVNPSIAQVASCALAIKLLRTDDAVIAQQLQAEPEVQTIDNIYGRESVMNDHMSLFEAVAEKTGRVDEVQSMFLMESLSDIDLQRLTLDMENKQVFITRLTVEVDMKVAEIKRLSTEVLQLQEQNRNLLQKRSENKRALAEAVDSNQVAFDASDLITLPRDEIINSYIEMSQRFVVEVEKGAEYQSRIQFAQNAWIAKNETERQLLVLEQQHRDTSALVQDLQEKVQSASKYEEASRKQQEVIRRLEDIINTHKGVVIDRQTSINGDIYNETLQTRNKYIDTLRQLHERASQPQQPSALDMYVDAPATMTQTSANTQLQEQYQQLLATSASLQQELQSLNSTAAPEGDGFGLTMRLEAAEQRTASIQSEIDRAAKMHATRVTTMKSELRQKEAAFRFRPKSLT